MRIEIKQLSSGKPALDPQALEIFRQQWNTYRKMLDNDYLSHRSAEDMLHRILVDEFEHPFTFLDLACGDAHRMTEILAGTTVAHYTGIDLSEPALRLAAKSLEQASFPVDLYYGDLIDGLDGPLQTSDVVWCGLCIHHLQTEEKLQTLAKIRSKTRKLCLIYEPTRAAEESRSDYMERFLRTYRQAWSRLTAQEWEQISTHVTSCDFPERKTDWLDLGARAGFSKSSVLSCPAASFACLYRYDVS